MILSSSPIARERRGPRRHAQWRVFQEAMFYECHDACGMLLDAGADATLQSTVRVHSGVLLGADDVTPSAARRNRNRDVPTISQAVFNQLVCKYSTL
jgi:hypothetical protein